MGLETGGGDGSEIGPQTEEEIKRKCGSVSMSASPRTLGTQRRTTWCICTIMQKLGMCSGGNCFQRTWLIILLLLDGCYHIRQHLVLRKMEIHSSNKPRDDVYITHTEEDRVVISICLIAVCCKYVVVSNFSYVKVCQLGTIFIHSFITFATFITKPVVILWFHPFMKLDNLDSKFTLSRYLG